MQKVVFVKLYTFPSSSILCSMRIEIASMTKHTIAITHVGVVSNFLCRTSSPSPMFWSLQDSDQVLFCFVLFEEKSVCGSKPIFLETDDRVGNCLYYSGYIYTYRSMQAERAC